MLCWACEKFVKHRLWSCPQNTAANSQKILQNFRKWWDHGYSHPPANTLQVPANVEALKALQATGTRKPEK